MEMMAAEGSSEEWVQTEIARQLEQLSLEDLEEEETATENGAHSPPSSQVPHRLGAINLYANPVKCSAASSLRAPPSLSHLWAWFPSLFSIPEGKIV